MSSGIKGDFEENQRFVVQIYEILFSFKYSFLWFFAHISRDLPLYLSCTSVTGTSCRLGHLLMKSRALLPKCALLC